MPIAAQENGNVPLIGPRARYNTLGVSPSWHYHRMAGGSSLNGVAPQTATDAPNDLDPEVTAGLAVWANLTQGGFFTMLGKAKKNVVVEATDLSSGVTLVIANLMGTTIRPTPSTPFKLTPGEFLKASGGAAGGYAGVLVRLDAEKIL